MKKGLVRYFSTILVIIMVILSFPTKVEAAWYQNNTGWRWKDQNSSYSVNEWENINGHWYYFGSDGYMESGWQYIEDNWYYLGESNDGAMKSGWQCINGYWYYLGAANDGAMKFGWQNINGCWYYLGEANDGAMKFGWQCINGSWYYLGESSDGAMKFGWQYIGENWYYLGESNDGAMKYGWQYIGENRYYLGESNDGSMKSGWQYIEENWYYLGEASDGAMKIGWQTIEGEEYYFYEDGRRAAIITQYVDKTGSQAMFYTIETTKGDLIVIDGGWSENADYVRSVIKEKENHVSAWVLTHPHPDHIGAFNTIYADLQGIEIDDIYTIDMDYELYEEYAQYYDSFSTYETFCTLTKDAENLHYLYNGDVLDIGGCQIKVYNAYDDTIPNITKDLCNVGSMVFEVFGESSSMLFTSDINGKAICSKIIEQYGEELAATYMQVAHHGNQSVNHEFFDLVSPEVAFFDAPDWLIVGENYDTQENIDYMESLGAEVYTYETTPNRVILK